MAKLSKQDREGLKEKARQWRFAEQVIRRMRDEQGEGELNFSLAPDMELELPAIKDPIRLKRNRG